MKTCEFKEAWNRHEPNCAEEAMCTVECTLSGLRIFLVLCAEHREAILLAQNFKAVDVSNTEDARHRT